MAQVPKAETPQPPRISPAWIDGWVKALLLVAAMLLNWWEVRKLREEQAARDLSVSKRFEIVETHAHSLASRMSTLETDARALKEHAALTDQRLMLILQLTEKARSQ
jgi:hypothetical protein